MGTQTLSLGADTMVQAQQTHCVAMYSKLQVNLIEAYYKAKNITM